MSNVTLTEESMQALANTFESRGLMVVTKTVASFGLGIDRERKKLMSKTHVSAYKVEKYKLFDKQPTLKTIKNWIEKNILGPKEFFIEKGKLMIMTEAINRINNEA
jgi:hypothetical protein